MLLILNGQSVRWLKTLMTGILFLKCETKNAIGIFCKRAINTCWKDAMNNFVGHFQKETIYCLLIKRINSLIHIGWGFVYNCRWSRWRIFSFAFKAGENIKHLDVFCLKEKETTKTDQCCWSTDKDRGSLFPSNF